MLNRIFRVLKRSRLFAVCVLSLVLVLSGLWVPKITKAGNFSMQTGYYVGTGASSHAITGLGFQPDMVLIKSSTNAGVAVFKTSSMGGTVTAYTSATADDASTAITFTSGGFTLGTLANVNNSGVIYYWVAFTGSDCSATGNFCVGSYTGNNTSPRNITTVGFQPNFVMVKRSTAVDGHFRTASEAANETLFFTTTARDTAGNYIRSFLANGFSVGATDNANLATYYFVAFKTTSGSMIEGTYTGNGADGRNMTGLGFQPDFMLTKNATSTNAARRNPVMNFTETNGDNSCFIGAATANQTDSIQLLQSDGFQLGTADQANRNGDGYYYVAFGGASNYSGNGSFNMQTGLYSGNGTSQAISGLGFRPDLVIVKGASTTQGVFRTFMMKGDSTAYLGAATANLAGAVTSIDSDGFTVGNNAVTNTSATVYQWQAFGNAFDPYDNSGAADFAIGAYYGNGVDATDILRVPFQPDMVTVKRSGATAGVWRSTATGGDLSSFFGATAESADYIQALNADGFDVGTNAAVNTAANIYWWFAFKEGANFDVGSHTGTGAAHSVTGIGFRPELVWNKRSTAVNGVHRSVSLAGNNTQYFVNTANVSDRITGFVKGGFAVGGSQTETNTNTGTYRYAAWNNSVFGTLSLDIVDAGGSSVASPAYAMNSIGLGFECNTATGTVGVSAQRLRIQNGTTTPTWTVSIAATSGATALWSNGGSTQQYDFNDPSGSPAGCADGADAGDTRPGQLTINPATATIAPETGCTSSNISLGSSTAFSQGVTDSIVLASASASADADCYWDITGLSASQKIPAEQAIDNYTINFTITIVAS